MAVYRRTKAGIAICPYFTWQSEDIRNRSENDVNLTYCSHKKNLGGAYEGNCQADNCPLTVLKIK